MASTTHVWGELAHPIRQDSPGEGRPPWKDNSYLAFWDPAEQVNGVVHVSTSPNAEGRRARASVSVAGRTAEVVEDLEPYTFDSASISIDLNGTFAVRSATFELQLDVAPRSAVADYNAKDLIPALVAGEPVQHYQGCAVVTGKVTIGGETTPISGVGMRDRTWGFRDESQMWPEYAGLIADIDGRLLSVMKFMRMDGTTKVDGYLLGDEAVPVTGFDDITRDAAGLFVGARVTVSDGTSFTARIGERTGGFWVPMGWERTGPAMSAYDEFFSLTTDDGRTGHGFVEQGIVRRLA